MNNISYRQKTFLLILLFSIARLFVAGTMELGGDETYYWLYGQELKWNYFDHPPMVGIWVRVFTLNLWLQYQELFIRLGSVLGGALASYFLYKTCKLLHSAKAGFYAACLYNASFYSGIVAGIFIMPDSPQMVFYTFSLWMIARIIQNDEKWVNWILFGVGAGLCVMSKIHGIFLWFGLGLFTLFMKTRWLKKAQLYVAALITLVIISPIFIWNFEYHFITYRFHSERVEIDEGFINIKSFFAELVSQFGFNNPFNVVAIIAAVVAYAKRKLERADALTVYNLIGIPLALLLLFISLFRNTVLPHWSGPAYVALMPLAAIYLAGRKPIKTPAIIYWSTCSFIAFLFGWQLFNNQFPGTYGSKDNNSLGWGDVTLDKYAWKEAGEAFAQLYAKEQAAGVMPADAPIVSYKWWASHLDYYFASRNGIPVIGLGIVEDLHEYLWMNNKRKDDVNFSKAYVVMPTIERYNVTEKYAAYYSTIEPVTVIRVTRNGLPAHHFYVYRLSGWKNKLPIPKKPRPLNGEEVLSLIKDSNDLK